MSEMEETTPDNLNDRQVRFCQEYIIDLNATQAYIRAGYSEATADPNAHRLMGNDRVKDYIQELMDKRARRLRITADDVLVRLDAMSKASPKGLFDDEDRVLRVSQWSDDFAQSVNGIKFTKQRSAESTQENPIYEDVVDVKLVDKKGATELLGKHLKLFTDQFEINGELPVTRLIVELSDERAPFSDNDE